MVADLKTIEGERIELADLGAGSAQGHPKGIRQTDRTERVDEHAHSRAALLGPNEGLAKALAQGPDRESVGFQANRSLGGIDGGEHCGKDLLAGAEPVAVRSSCGSQHMMFGVYG